VGEGDSAGEFGRELVERAELEVPVVGEVPIDGRDREGDDVFLEPRLDDEVGTDVEVLVVLVADAGDAADVDRVLELRIDLAGESAVDRGDETELPIDDVDDGDADGRGEAVVDGVA
jgi:hypothetical protein